MIKFGILEESGYHLTRELLLLNPKPTVIYACNNQMGLGVMNALKENTKDPRTNRSNVLMIYLGLTTSTLH